MALENFTTYDQSSDPNTRQTVAANKLSWANMTAKEDCYLADDKGVDHFSGDFTHKLKIQYHEDVANPLAAFWLLANALDDFKGLDDANEDFMVLYHFGDVLMRIGICENGTLRVDSFASTDGEIYFVTIDRDDGGGVNGTGQLTAEIHTGDYHPSGVHKDLLTLDCAAGEQNDFRYIYALNSYNHGLIGSGDGYTENLDLQEAPPAGMAGAMTTNSGYWGW